MVNPVKLNVGTALVWRDSGGDYALTADGLAATAGRIGARGDLGAWPRAKWWRWYLETAWAATPTADQTLEFWIAPWDTDTPAFPFAQVAATDSALASVTVLKNCINVGSVIVQSASTAIMSSGGLIQLPYRYVSPILYNTSGTKALAAVGTTPTILRLTPVFDELQ